MLKTAKPIWNDLENVFHGFHFGEGKFQTQPNSKKKTVRNYKRRRKRLEKNDNNNNSLI